MDQSQILDQINTKAWNFHGRQIKNAGDATEDQDYVTFSQLKKVVSEIDKAVTVTKNRFSGGGGGGSSTDTWNYVDAVKDFGLVEGSGGNAAANKLAFETAFAAAAAQNRGLYIRGGRYKIDKTNINIHSGTTPYGYPVYIFSDGAGIAGTGQGNGAVFECTGVGAAWLKGAFNIVRPNGGNTALDNNYQLHGIHLRNIILDHVGTGLAGFWFHRCFKVILDECGIYNNASAGKWVAGIITSNCTDVKLNHFRAFDCVTGIQTNEAIGSAWDTSTLFEIYDCDIQNCTNGIATPYTDDVLIKGGSILNGVGTSYGLYLNSKNTIIEDVYINGCVNNWDMLTATASTGTNPNWQSSTRVFAPDNVIFRGVKSYGSGSMYLRDSEFPIIAECYLNGHLTIDSACSHPRLIALTKLGTFTDNCATTSYIERTPLNTSPIGIAAGIRGQQVLDYVNLKLYQCSTSGPAGVAVYWLINNYVVPTAWPSWFPVVSTAGGGNYTVSQQTTKYRQDGKDVRMRAGFNGTITGVVTLIHFSLPVNTIFTSLPLNFDQAISVVGSLAKPMIGFIDSFNQRVTVGNADGSAITPGAFFFSIAPVLYEST